MTVSDDDAGERDADDNGDYDDCDDRMLPRPTTTKAVTIRMAVASAAAMAAAMTVTIMIAMTILLTTVTVVDGDDDSAAANRRSNLWLGPAEGRLSGHNNT